MDPVGPWSGFPSYNRLAGVQPTATSSAELHHLPGGGTPGAPTTTAQLLPGSFLAPTGVSYETVFSPLFHTTAGAKPGAHYVTQVAQHRAQALVQAQVASSSKQAADSEYHQAQGFFEQGGSAAWQQNSPFGILPHESIVPTTTSKTPYENFNPHFVSQGIHLNANVPATNAKTSAARSQSPQTPSTTKANAVTTIAFYQVPASYVVTSTATSNSSNLQQTCIVTTPSVPSAKEFRSVPTRTFISSPNPPPRQEKPFVAKQQPTTQQIQTKAQTKIYPDLANQAERHRNADEQQQSQSSPISFSVIDASGRVNYAGSNSSNKRAFPHGNYRHYPQSEDFQRKGGPEYNSNGPECNVTVPRRPSPLQAHSQASPLGHAQSPAYPMYHSPMNSISSPQQPSNQVTPPSPLDASVPRPTSQGSNVVYPSVITRALNSEKNFPDRYERNNQTNNCWDDRQPNRKFPNNQNSASQTNNYASNNIDTRNDVQARATTLNVPDRQHTFFDSASGHQVTLQDLSSCRGDPMSLVKNLQQQGCQVPVAQHAEPKPEPPIKQPARRRKSGDKTNVQNAEIPVRIPPPAHSSGGNPQQQNGAYFDFDRWNLPPPAKIFASQPIHQQHQGIMVPHPHGPHAPPIPYFPSFHLSAPNPNEYQSTVELAPVVPVGNYHEEAPQQPTTSQYPVPEDQPKVVVPNIEEELNFLAEGTVKAPSNPSTKLVASSPASSSAIKPLEKPLGPGAGFMSSYLKFLQGERDTSPPPASRGARKQTWAPPPTTPANTSTTTPTEPSADKTSNTNGLPATTPVKPTPPPPPPVVTRLSQGDPQDDPRYFPLPKERKRGSFDSSDDGISSDDDFFSVKSTPPVEKKEVKEKVVKKKSPSEQGEKKKIKQNEAQARREMKQKQKEEKMRMREEKIKQKEMMKLKKLAEVAPRRQSVKRAAKEKKVLECLIKEDEGDEPPEFADSDSDPAWTPQAKDDSDDDMSSHKKNKRNRSGLSSKKRRNLITAAAQGAGINETDGYGSDTVSYSKKNKSGSKNKLALTLEDSIAASLHRNSQSDDNPFRAGEFVVIKADMKQDWPAIWRVDGKNLLQKYEPFESEGKMLYRNISTYTSWTPENKKQYISVPVRSISQSHTETIVEFLKLEVLLIDEEYQKTCMKDCESYQDNFEVYIQTLISQALDSNFLTEIFQEQDDYFLCNVKMIDDITESKKNKLLTLMKWPAAVQSAVCTWPCYNVIREINAGDADSKNCAACTKMGIAVRVLMYGQPYNATTLEGCQPDPNAISEKDFLMCRICANRVELTNKITHQKYLMYIECAKRVSEKRALDPSKDTTCILNELLADETWLTQLFLEVRTTWSEVDCIEHSYKKNNSARVK